MQIGNALIDQVEKWSIIENIHGIFCTDTKFLGQEIYDSGIFHVQNDSISFHILLSLNFLIFHKSNTSIKHPLISNAYLLVRLFKYETFQGFFPTHLIGKIQIERIENTVIGYAATNHIILFIDIVAHTTCRNKIEPFSVISVKMSFI